MKTVNCRNTCTCNYEINTKESIKLNCFEKNDKFLQKYIQIKGETWFIEKGLYCLYRDIIDMTSGVITDNISERIFCVLNGLDISPKCYCGAELGFEFFSRGYRKYCSVKCRANSTEWYADKTKTLLEKYGVEHQSHIEAIKASKSEKLKRNSYISNLSSTERRQNSIKIKRTNFERYGGVNTGWLPHAVETRLKNGNLVREKDRTEYRNYKLSVLRVTNETLRNYGHLIPNLDKRDNHARNKDAYHLDHKVSIIDGFHGGVDPVIMGSLFNLQCIPYLENLRKRHRSCITLPDLIAEYNKDEIRCGGLQAFVGKMNLSTIEEVMDKLDGSLISTVRVSDKEFFLKSKGSFYSGQAQAAAKLLATDEYEELRSFIRASMLFDYTVNMEYMAPDNRIVIGYMKPTLKVLNVRCNRTGDYIGRDQYVLNEKFRVAVHPIPVDGEAWLAETYASQDDIEGYVARLSCGTWFKVKTEKYCALHHTKDSITIPRRLFEACVNGGADDLRAMFASDALAVMQINEMDELVRSIYNRIHGTTNRFHAAHHHEDRKTYALAGQADPVIQADGTFGIVMNYYLDKEADIESFMIKNYKKFGIKDEAPTTAE